MIEYLLLLTAPLLGIILASLTKDEEHIYKTTQYYPTIIPLLTILTIISSFTNKTLALTSAYLLFMTMTWASR